ncbi:DNA polymerase III subunit gamma/tau [Helicobacter sp. MIT 99-5507]|uniref:DNA polymerase III subunit gamma/tau n=1 Tax=Helicobacter sp. MIT 99-5507 TaxID=152489 RepID=UPI000E1E8E03|nr:DNA polymerase III subunit gamma/tau [Helicobacter sp. MIT 99-5507]RDU58015.1 DNA polymerase III subunit gamma/tau [Helicobacter sp. MIT 99-5507]
MSKALSLKYRPLKFSDLIGQDSISQTLSLALDLNKVSHAYLFSGLRGSGKTSSARIFARALECEKFPTSVPCGECPSCKSSLNNTHMDIIEMDAASSRSIDDIKDLIEQIQYKPAYSRFKIFIIDEVHMLTKEAFNALLKTLEEPPEYVKFILATTDPLKLPPTILSRTQHFRFKKIPQNSISTHLKRILGLENVKFEDEAIDLLSRNCGGSLRDALTLLEQSIIFSKENVTLESVSSMLGALNPSVIEDFFNSILSKNDSKIESILKEFESYEVENIIDEMIIFLKYRMLSKDSRYSLIVIDRFFRILGDAKNMLFQNAESSFVLLLTTLKLKEALNIDEINKIIAKIEREVISFNNEAIKNDINTDSNNSSNPIKDSVQDSIKDPKDSIKDSTNLLSPKSQFEQLVDKIYNRNYELGELFKKNIEFVDFKDSILTWNSKADGEEKNKLRQFFSVIVELVYEVFGKNTKIVTPKQNKEEQKPKEPEIIRDIENIFGIVDKKIINNKEK